MTTILSSHEYEKLSTIEPNTTYTAIEISNASTTENLNAISSSTLPANVTNEKENTTFKQGEKLLLIVLMKKYFAKSQIWSKPATKKFEKIMGYQEY